MRRFFLIAILLIFSCDTGDLKVIMDIPMALYEVSGIEIDKKTGLIWMVNDSGNKPILYGLDLDGSIKREIKIKAKNRDWEDLTTDAEGTVYIGNFGNNDNDSENLSILKIHADSIASNKSEITPEVIRFNYPEQEKFPPKKKDRHFDCEAFFFFENNLYLFTKSRSPKEEGKTNLYLLPSKSGTYKAKLLDTFNTCDKSECWVTSADINENGDKLALLTENSVFVFSELNKKDFFKSKFKRYEFDYNSQKESVLFKNDSTLYIADEYLGTQGGNLYEFKIN
ncbi:hypothetical protein DFQ05_2426 [Winogradskyella wandonensis]|uniref:SdiA-regulated protein n=1 Tax=Winogradskyella wandonensis TaxID=1442586 RepID=A0A4R1KLR9_9FLAO|nr:hypothetical protein [Winogradskyella wandonensis]TCK65210.1 hypothetical protein DFQ05_2426 [Winogradskyella wandonensis]